MLKRSRLDPYAFRPGRGLNVRHWARASKNSRECREKTDQMVTLQWHANNRSARLKRESCGLHSTVSYIDANKDECS